MVKKGKARGRLLKNGQRNNVEENEERGKIEQTREEKNGSNRERE